MASDFTVLFDDRLHFGSHAGFFDDETFCPAQQLGPPVTFAGASKTVSFETPDIDVGQPAVLMYQAFDVTTTQNVFTLNDIEIPGGIPVDTRRCEWKNNWHILAPGSLTSDRANTLYIEALGETGDAESRRDNFALTNAVILYKTLD
jgi:hypothetical protein